MPSTTQTSPSTGSQTQGNNTTDPTANTQESSKFKRFLKRFGRRPSEEGRESDIQNQTQPGTDGPENGLQNNFDGRKNSSLRSRKGSKTNGTSTQNGKGKRSESMLSGRFFQTSPNAPAIPSSTGGRNAPLTAPLDNTNVGGLANTLTVPGESDAPQLSGVPQHEPLVSADLITPSVAAAAALPISIPSNGDQNYQTGNNSADNAVIRADDHALAHPNGTANDDHANLITANGISNGQGHVLSPQGSYGSSQSRNAPSFDDDESADVSRGRDSVDNRTMDTGKSRASTKPTTLMSMDTRENVQGSNNYTPMAQIAQHRHGEVYPSQNRVGSLRGGESVHNAPSSIQFASAPPMGRTPSGTIVQLPGQDEAPEEMPYAHVPTVSRPHPSNNPHPSGIPADNASVLTLASSTAAASIGGGAASSRGHQSHAAPSFGGARSIGGSLMGERRNSSDTYASLKALPPLSRRGSDSSSRTGMSVAASATGRNSAQAMMGTNAAGGIGFAGPGAPGDRISIHRTPSQKTVATQLSIPLSHSNVALGQQQQQADNASITSHLDPGAAHHLAITPQTSNVQSNTSSNDVRSEGEVLSEPQANELPSITTT
ncbi:uncharacterized protein FA14DRAFT_175011 [Meira miltonrushii]|uniref:Uncharacterized protein n=1 Tax=Meira miltonrushii TaxID=1280837 RepID=A0A316V9K2_9BASI|nr:uncharacterized protein FA14DRAFT_175011 [Meira miltonrushii]PWN32165.1 hypothetical protein FA14DRAFT_175011 [Meira miltonrushii]